MRCYFFVFLWMKWLEVGFFSSGKLVILMVGIDLWELLTAGLHMIFARDINSDSALVFCLLGGWSSPYMFTIFYKYLWMILLPKKYPSGFPKPRNDVFGGEFQHDL